VVALDDVAAQGTNGLYTTVATSDHSSLRRFFPLQVGDAAVHTWDVLHGVDVEDDVRRTSLIVWFTTARTEGVAELVKAAPWIANRKSYVRTNDVAQFVLAAAIESSHGDNEHQHYDQHPHDLYLQSASHGNAFALSRLGGLCQQGDLTPQRAHQALSILNKLRPPTELPPSLGWNEILWANNEVPFQMLSKLLWYEGAMRGLASSQLSLAYALVEEASLSDCQDLRLLAAVLATCADQQGVDGAYACLSEIVRLEIESMEIETDEDFCASPVIKTFNSWRS